METCFCDCPETGRGSGALPSDGPDTLSDGFDTRGLFRPMDAGYIDKDPKNLITKSGYYQWLRFHGACT